MGRSASSPGKVILFGEHAINRGAAALAAPGGLHAPSQIQESGGETAACATPENSREAAVTSIGVPRS